MIDYRLAANQWLGDPSRPKIACAVLAGWRALIADWVEDPTMPLLIRKMSASRGSVIDHPSGRAIVPTDNSPANWTLAHALAGSVPRTQEVMMALKRGDLPVAMMFKAQEKQRAVYTGTRVKMQNPPSPNTAGWKVCHIDPVAPDRQRLAITDRPIDELKSMSRRFLDPNNIFVVHLKEGWTHGLGENAAFVQAIRERRDAGGPPWCE